MIWCDKALASRGAAATVSISRLSECKRQPSEEHRKRINKVTEELFPRERRRTCHLRWSGVEFFDLITSHGLSAKVVLAGDPRGMKIAQNLLQFAQTITSLIALQNRANSPRFPPQLRPPPPTPPRCGKVRNLNS
jgi:hypothetical protein